MIVTLIAVVVIFVVVRFFVLTYSARPTFSNVAGVAAVACFGLGIWTNASVFTPPPSPPPPAAPASPAAVASAALTPVAKAAAPLTAAQLARLSPAKEPALGAIDGITSTQDGNASSADNTYPAGSTLFVRGWAANVDKTPLRGLIIVVDKKVRIDGSAEYGGARPDVATAYNVAAMASTGFSGVPLRTAGWSKGTHLVEVAGLSADRLHFHPVAVIAHFALR